MPLSSPYLLPGRGSGLPGRRGSRAPLLFAFIVFFGLLLAGVYLFWQRQGGGQHETAQAPVVIAPPARPAPLADTTADDVTLHIRNARGRLQDNLAQLARAQERLVLVADTLERDYLSVEERRLRTALASCQQASFQASAALEELSIADAQLNRKDK